MNKDNFVTQKPNFKKAFIQIPLLVVIFFSTVIISGIGYGAYDYYKTSKILKESEQLAKEEKYDEAIKKLEIAQNKLFGKSVFKQKVEIELEKNKKLLEDKTEYTHGIEEFNKGNWEKAKELLSRVSEIFPSYPDAKNKIEEAQQKIIEKQIAEKLERITEEAKKNIEETKEIAEEAYKKILEKEEKIQSSSGEKITSSELQPYLTGVVKVICFGPNYTRASGSLMVLNGRYFVLTNAHVIPNYTTGCQAFVQNMSGQTMGIYDLLWSFPYRWNYNVDAVLLEIISAKADFPSKPPSQLNYNISFLPYCSLRHPLGSPVVVIGYPAFSKKELEIKDEVGSMYFLTITEGIITAHDSTTDLKGLPDVNYFVSAKIDAGNSGGIALSKNKNGELCVLGLPTWISLGVYETQGVVQSIYNVFYRPPE